LYILEEKGTNGEPLSALHVVARTQSNPPIYYYRQWVDEYRWTAWTKIDLDIVSDHVLPVVWNRQLYLFWAIINRKPDATQDRPELSKLAMPNPNPDPNPDPNKKPTPNVPSDVKTHLEVQLAWSKFKGKWLPKQTAQQVIVLRDPFDDNEGVKKTNPINPYQVTLKSTIDYPMLRIDLFVNLSHCAEFLVGGAGSSVETFVWDSPYTKNLSEVGPETDHIVKFPAISSISKLQPPQGSSYEAMTLVPTSSHASSQSWRQYVYSCYIGNHFALDTPVDALLLSEADFYHLLVPHQIKDFDSSGPLFYEDSLHSYFVVPRLVTELTSPSSTMSWRDVLYRFIPFYHPFVPLFIRRLNQGGLDALFSRDLQVAPTEIKPTTASFKFDDYYRPNLCQGQSDDNDHIDVVGPIEGVDFEPDAGYAIYNWELFFHAPFHIGESLSLNQQFENARDWYHFIFNPTSSTRPKDSTPLEMRKPYWVTKPFYNPKDSPFTQIKDLMELINRTQGSIKQVDEWRKNPFDPHVIAQSREVAYQRTIVMKYIDNLIAWGDQLFRQDTMESINEATQMYVLAAEILGPRPELVKPLVVPPDKTYAELEKDLDDFANASILAAENLLGPIQGSGSNPSAPELSALPTLYFSIPPNDQLLGYWDKVANRLFKIRHGMNIEGVKRQLALFAPPIDPGLLAKAAAAGLSISDILSDTSVALPPYRFRVMVREAIELCEMVRGFGNELLGALEKSDAEALALKRSGYEKKLQEQIRTVMQKKLDEATQQIDVLEKQRKIILDRQSFYNQHKDEWVNVFEAAALASHTLSLKNDVVALKLEEEASFINMLPNAQFGASGAGGSPHVTVVWGSSNVSSSVSSMSGAMRIASAILQTNASMSQIMGTSQRRKEEFGLQHTLATDELYANDSQNAAAEIRQDIAQKELDNHEINVELATKVDEFLHDKYTNKELYDWMISQTSATYFQAYHLAYTLAKRAEICFKRELGLGDSSYSPYIQFGYWDSLKKGLLAGDKLLYDLQRLKSAYYEQNKRELEITKHISLLSLDPYALVKLRSEGECEITLPEILFDLDNPGHYMRRIKSVGITVPCVVGPYAGVSMTLTLHDNHVRTDPSSSAYAFYNPNNKNNPGFIDDQGGISSIVTSSAQNDRGMFELKFDDERYLPFECAGAISSWKLRLNPVYPQFDYSTISDVIIHLQYTARDGGDDLRDKVKGRDKVTGVVKDELKNMALAESGKGLYLLISARHEFGSSWQKFITVASRKDQELNLDIAPDRFPLFTRGLNITIKGMDLIAKLSDGDYNITVCPPAKDAASDGGAITKEMTADSTLGGLHHLYINDKSEPRLTPVKLGSTLKPNEERTWVFRLESTKNTTDPLSASDIEDLLIVMQYSVEEEQQST
jgi:hypothetical protein